MVGRRVAISCSDSETAPSPPSKISDPLKEPIVESWVTNTARNFLINLFGTRSPFRTKYDIDTLNSSKSALGCEAAASQDSDADTSNDRLRADRFLSVIRSGVQHGLFDEESAERDWAKVQDERVNRAEFGEAVMAAGLPDMAGIDIDDLFGSMDADHDGELRSKRAPLPLGELQRAREAEASFPRARGS